jgi:hypothetical protein
MGKRAVVAFALALAVFHSKNYVLKIKVELEKKWKAPH